MQGLQSAVHALQEHHSTQAEQAAARAGVLWQQYGEQSTFYFHHLSQQRKRATTLPGVIDSQGTGVVDLSTSGGRAEGGEILAGFFSSESPHGLFRPQPTVPQAQEDFLSAVDARLTPEASAACEGEAEPLTLEELWASLRGMPRGKQPGSDGIP